MEWLNPECDDNIIVGILYNGSFCWYVTDREIWFLDYEKRINAYKEKGFEVKEEYVDETRRGILILNSDNAKLFLKRIESQRIESKRLRELLQKARNVNDDSWFFDYRPSLFVDFDSCKLFSSYSEPASYEEYVPINWQGSYSDFIGLVPDGEKYWLDEHNENLLEKEPV